MTTQPPNLQRTLLPDTSSHAAVRTNMSSHSTPSSHLQFPLRSVSVTDPPLLLGSGRWLMLEQISFAEPGNDTERTWEVCRRRGREGEQRGVDAVDIHAILKSPTGAHQPLILLVVQYRPSLNAYCVEFPSGLIDMGETPAQAAQRELLEETGYIAEPVWVSTPVAYEPGMTDSCSCVAHVEIDTSLTHNQPRAQKLEDDEWSLQTVCLPVSGLHESLHNLEQQHPGLLIIDSRVYAFATGLRMQGVLSGVTASSVVFEETIPEQNRRSSAFAKFFHRIQKYASRKKQ